MEIPGHGVVGHEWDLRDGVDNYLGNVNFSGKRVLEIGPASGFLTMEMEKRGADIVAVEVTDDPGWDFVPYPASVMGPVMATRPEFMRKMKNSFWHVHSAHKLKSKLFYGNPCKLPDSLGHFDIALMASVLLHTKNPLDIITECSRKADVLIIADMYDPTLEAAAICRLHPTASNKEIFTIVASRRTE